MWFFSIVEKSKYHTHKITIIETFRVWNETTISYSSLQLKLTVYSLFFFKWPKKRVIIHKNGLKYIIWNYITFCVVLWHHYWSYLVLQSVEHVVEVLAVRDDVVFPWPTVSPYLYRGVIAEQETRYRERKQIILSSIKITTMEICLVDLEDVLFFKFDLTQTLKWGSRYICQTVRR